MISPLARWHLEYRAPGEDWQASSNVYQSYEQAELSKWYLERIYGLEIRISLHEGRANETQG